MNNKHSKNSDHLEPGDLSHFYERAAPYDDKGAIYFGIVVEVGEAYRPDYSPLYGVMCDDGVMRDFFDGERYEKDVL
ncbi:hypothetical protein CMI47_19375 [Candidatus Pacearchaeota archaeon]|nr:hypothetical protein [Candidatus Pacearchaeota archaeon]|tara:strand:+ start:714 stop:944 length:231 start_codon:yes stop_codon:yes gene_type:complete